MDDPGTDTGNTEDGPGIFYRAENEKVFKKKIKLIKMGGFQKDTETKSKNLQWKTRAV